MSGFGGFGGFGANNNNNQQQNTSSPFGGFGTNNNTSSGFGSNTNNTSTGFGNTSNAGGLFGGGGASSGFGSSGGFGSSNTGAFGAAKPAFGANTASTTGGLFGSTPAATTNTGFGGFGATSAAPATSNPFGASSSTTGGLFGASKPAFGASATGGFGSGTTTTGFGGGATGGFGAPASTALGGTVGDCQGTGGTPFQPFVEKEANSTGGAQNAYQSITFQQPYQKWSSEELRLADYAQGRRNGNGTAGATGAFGTTNFGGGFGATSTTNTGFGANTNNTGTGLFGNNNANNNTGFGSNNTTSAFAGSNTGGGLFGAAKPATGGLFGNSATTQPSGGLFGAAPSTGFGAPTTNTNTGFGANNSGNSLFGGAANNNKPATGFSFGATGSTGGFGANTASNTTGGFGNNASTTGGGLFGGSNNTATGSAFGQNNQQPQQANSLFGGFGSNNTNATPQAGNSLFGNANAAKPAGGLFGNTAPATGGLFGNNNQANTASANPFGGPAQNTSGGLFGAKPAATGSGGLFGNNSTSTGGGLFGGNTGAPTSGGLFGGTNNNAASGSLFGGNTNTGGGLFGAKPAATGTGGLFGGGSTTNNGGGMFGSSAQNNQQQQNPAMGASMFGQQQNLQPGSLTASINDPTAFGTSMFSNLGSPENNPGPLATPLSSLSKQKKPNVLQMYNLNPASASRFSTPTQKRGFGFSYSTYGTPASASSTSTTPLAMGSSMLGSSLGGRLTKSMSTSSLRGTFNREDSILAPGAFSASPSTRFNSTGSMKKLVINRAIRTDLFSPPARENTPGAGQGSILKKRVSFDTSTLVNNNNNNKQTNGATSPLKQVDNTGTPSADETRSQNSSAQPTQESASKSNGNTNQSPEMEQVKGKELAIVPEEEATAPTKSRPQPVSQEDQAPGAYWSSPTKEELDNMTRSEKSQVNFTVGRDGVGKIEFGKPVDLNSINYDDLFGKIINLNVRSATVYPTAASKPPMGKGLNVPSRIELENSWPRNKGGRLPSHEKSGPRFQKHIERLTKVPDTKFVDYDKDTGVWTFTVEHFTTYGLEYDDETEGEGVSDFNQSTYSEIPDTPTPRHQTPRAAQYDTSFASTEGGSGSDPDDTFEFKKRKILPGAFDDQAAFEDDDADMEDQEDGDNPEQSSFLDERSVGSQPDEEADDRMEDVSDIRNRELVRIEGQEMAGSYPDFGNTMEQDEVDTPVKLLAAGTPAAILRARMHDMRTASPSRSRIQVNDDDWTNILQRSVSPRKHDRGELRRLAQNLEEGAELPTPKPKNRVVSADRGFATSIDLMHSLFDEAKSPVKAVKAAPKPRGFEWPYSKSSEAQDASAMTPMDQAFHDSVRPSWGPDGSLVYASSSTTVLTKSSRRAKERDGLLVVQHGAIVSEGKDIRFAHFSNESSAAALEKQKVLTSIEVIGGIPKARLKEHFKMTELFHESETRGPAAAHEKLVWQLAGVLFDTIEVPEELKEVPDAAARLRQDNLSTFWQKLVESASSRNVALAKSSEEKAIASLSAHKIVDACSQLLDGKNFHLATLIALIGTKDNAKKDIREQLNAWQKSRILSEFSQPIRTLYELLAGNTCVCTGSKSLPVEDRMESYVISTRFGLDWRQAFGLRLWYGISTAEGMEAAVSKFEEDLMQDKETARPKAWYVEQGVPSLWKDERLDSREDLLWGLLKLFSNKNADLEAVLRPENSQLSPLDTRLSWQLSCALTASDRCSYGNDGGEKADHLTESLATQLNEEGSWLEAVFVLLHLSRPDARARAIQGVLCHNAEKIGAEDSRSFMTLNKDYHVPVAWIWEAKALYMRAVRRDYKAEVGCLLKASSYVEAHQTFSKAVGPTAVIERDWQTIRALLSGFEGKEKHIPDWHTGGALYSDYLCLIEGQKKGVDKIDTAVLERLFAVLPTKTVQGQHASFMETVAVQEMSSVVAKVAVELGKTGKNKLLPRVLRLPLTEDESLKHTVNLSLGYYRNLMASA